MFILISKLCICYLLYLVWQTISSVFKGKENAKIIIPRAPTTKELIQNRQQRRLLAP